MDEAEQINIDTPEKEELKEISPPKRSKRRDQAKTIIKAEAEVEVEKLRESKVEVELDRKIEKNP